MITRPITPLLCLLLGSGCVLQSEKWPRPRDLPPAWLVDGPRLLAVRADPPDAAPGQEVTFEALFPTPGADAPLTRIWFACPPQSPGGIGFGCFLDLAGVEQADPETLIEHGFIGMEPGLPPRFTVPDDALDGLSDPWDLHRGRQILIQVAALPPDLDPEAEVDFSELEVGYKRLIVRDTEAPNRNPEIAELTADSVPQSPSRPLLVAPGQRLKLHLFLEEDSVETYPHLTREGIWEERTEEPWVSWYTTDGTLSRPTTLHPFTYTDWEAPGDAAQGTLYAVVRDRRGGMAWWAQDWEVHP